MINPGIVYMLVRWPADSDSSVVHFHAEHLSLPLPPLVTIPVVVLPIGAFVNAYIYPNLLHHAHACTTKARCLSVGRLAPIVLQALQAVATAILAALLLEALLPSPALDRVLEREWRAMYDARDADRLRLVQDTYRCCGLRTIHDRAYPFEGTSCTVLYGRTVSCEAPWRSAMQATSTVDFAVVVVVALMQIVGLLIMRERTKWWTELRTKGWTQADYDAIAGQSLVGQGDEDEERGRGYGAVREPLPTPNMMERNSASRL
ncbi:hypothetical protein RJ55_03916 [Drechmeria coniospora]|nr:hypothetical protein RJ55_03916 [Drechmeria coniospora]